MPGSFLDLIRFGGHDLIKLRVFGEVVAEGDDGIAIKKQSLSLTAVGNIGKLIFGDVEMLGQDFLITTGLIEHVDKIGVIQDVLNLTGSQQVLDVLSDSRWDATPFAEAFPDFNRIGSGLFFLKH